MSEIPFQVNEFRTYQVVRSGISFGFIDTARGGYNPNQGEKFQYDGTTVILHDGREFTDAPQLRSAIREGWISPVGDKVTTYRPKAAGIQVRPAESRGRDLPIKTTIETERAEESTVVSVAERKRNREAVNAEATRKVPFQSQEARTAMEAPPAALPGWDSGDDEINELAGLFDEEMTVFESEDGAPEEEIEEDDSEAEVLAQAEADILEMLNAVEDNDTPAPRQRGATRPPLPATPQAAGPSARGMPIDNQDARPVMPIVRENVSENSGEVVGRVGDQNKIVVEREKEFALNVARATPENKSPAPKPRFGGVGAIVHDEQRDMGQISLSSNTPAIKLDESAAVSSSTSETIRMSDSAQVGPHNKTARKVIQTDQGVAVGRILTPTHQSFTADSRNTSASAIQRTAEGGRPKVEKYAVEREDAPVVVAKATGDVQEVRAGDTLEELLPDAAKPAAEVYRRPENDPAYEAIRMLIPDFKWNKDRPVKERVADALKKVKEPMYVKGILAVETELAREEIKKGLSALLEKTKAKKAQA